ncbi:MAG: phospholipase D-like domain-containing protein [Candidatus Sulfobium sp.]
MILEPGRNCQDVFDVWETGLLVDARNYYRALYHSARKARRYILLAGWQFDSEVSLLRGEDTAEAEGDTRLLPFLTSLCVRNPQLNVYVLAWDFSVVFSLEREWFQSWIFRWMTNERVHFIFDDKHAIGASHHQKLAVIDGLLAFVGGMDVCADRWDDASHLSVDPRRTDPGGDPYGPYHDIQSYHTGPAAGRLAELFLHRWINAGGKAFDPAPAAPDTDYRIDCSRRLPTGRVAVSRTHARSFTPFLEKPVQEIRNLYVDAIEAAEKLVYIENQYFSSHAVYDALKRRMTYPDRRALQVVIVLPEKPQALLEEISMGLVQAKMIRSLTETAGERGHSIGIYYSVAPPEDEISRATYIHSKLLLVDDIFLSVGSANATNRSMGLDTELNVSWEAEQEDDRLRRSIRHVRIALLAEHTGLGEIRYLRRFVDTEGLVGYLSELAEGGTCRLRTHTIESLTREVKWLDELGAEDFSLDPEKPVIEENVYEMLVKDNKGFFSDGIGILGKWLQSKQGSGEGK